MHMPRLPILLRSRSRLRGGAGLIRARIWLAMLGLAIVPMLGTILLTTTFDQRPPAVATERQGWETASAAGDLRSRMARLETQLLVVAADTTLRPLLDGVSGAEERQLASRAMSILDEGDSGLVVAACLIRGDADAGTSLLDRARSSSRTGIPQGRRRPRPPSVRRSPAALTARPDELASSGAARPRERTLSVS